ncbi:MAG: hypothetical protein ACI8PZ_002196 [Myxococcota bacterium]|jgi:hypothetical protein
MRTLITALIGLALSSPALAKDSEAETCLRNKVWDGYATGWGIRTMTTTEINAGKTKNYLVTLYRGNEYRIVSCADPSVSNLDVLIYDAQGNLLDRDTTTDREPSIVFTPKNTGAYYVVLYMREVKERKRAAEVSMAVVYR